MNDRPMTRRKFLGWVAATAAASAGGTHYIPKAFDYLTSESIERGEFGKNYCINWEDREIERGERVAILAGEARDNYVNTKNLIGESPDLKDTVYMTWQNRITKETRKDNPEFKPGVVNPGDIIKFPRIVEKTCR
jgi:hypothetical protein